MIRIAAPHRRATAADALQIAKLVNMAGEGLPLYLWTKMAEPGESPWAIGRQRATRERGSFSFRNAVVREQGSRINACLIGYPLPESPEPIDYEEMPAIFVPLQELENLAPNSWYVNVLATGPEYRGQGYGTALLSLAEALAGAARRPAMSIIVSDANTGARRLYEKCGYVERARRAMVKEAWKNPGKNWVLLVKGI